MRRLWSNSLVAKVFLSYLAVIAVLFASLFYASNTTLHDSYPVSYTHLTLPTIYSV